MPLRRHDFKYFLDNVAGKLQKSFLKCIFYYEKSIFDRDFAEICPIDKSALVHVIA